LEDATQLREGPAEADRNADGLRGTWGEFIANIEGNKKSKANADPANLAQVPLLLTLRRAR
jgi:hypothetical protein